ncbi:MULTISPECIES: hypothetical protein [unclassified Nocardioides]|uniref:hypothetical protein n=1 Tax=unclassified Nocardioides TaxID=2615069 RepID=UPI000B26C52E|nr:MULTISPECIES: hypothetical protein [unclassified Nocardioides]
MAMIIRGKSLCHICGLVVAEGDEIQLFPPALFASSSDAEHLNDSGVHLACFEALPEHDEAAAVLGAYLDRREAGDDLC